MKPLLFDTQALVLWATDQATRPVVEIVDRGCMVLVSIVSLWDCILKKPGHGFGLEYQQLLDVVGALEAELLPIRPAHLDTLRTLPLVERHKDPFDRLIISQTIHENLILVSGDRQFTAYQKFCPLQILWSGLK